MKLSKIILEVIVGVVLVIILGIFLNPTHLLMPDTVNTMLMLGLVVGFISFVGVIWREQAEDERDALHIQKSGRISFLVGSGIIVAGILYQATRHEVDPWLIYALVGMVLAKLVSLISHHFKN